NGEIPPGHESLYLIYWGEMRSRGELFTAQDKNWANDIYRHPDHFQHKPKRDRRHTMGHDIYSLGVCLLEIGLWESLVNGTVPSARLKKAIPGIDTGTEAWWTDEQIQTVKEELIELAREELPRTMGVMYSQLVVACLTCLDKKTEARSTWKNHRFYQTKLVQADDFRVFREVVLPPLMELSAFFSMRG
ncbi:hypothetical protein QBC44DRAFT_246691, partial [Cladorrhinum sp. PSN332]